MNQRRMAVQALVLAALAFGTIDQACAALSPGKVAKMKKEATDVFQVEVVDVKIEESDAIKKGVVIEAEIVAVERSGNQPMRGERIEIHSYQLADPDDPSLSRTDAVESLLERVGPKPPPLLEQGWKGTVYLNLKDEDGDLKQYDIAVFGHSFVASKAE